MTWAGGSAGGVDHITAALLARAVGVDATKVNYIAFSGGGEALAAILGGQVTAGISGYGEFEGQIKAGKLRVIGVSAPERVAGIDAPTFKEQGIDLVLPTGAWSSRAPGITAEQKKALGRLSRRWSSPTAWKDVAQAEGLGRHLPRRATPSTTVPRERADAASTAS